MFTVDASVWVNADSPAEPHQPDSRALLDLLFARRVGRIPTLRAWMLQEQFLVEGTIKPMRPKEALEKSLEFSEMQRSSSLYKQLAERVSLERCTDRAFIQLKIILRRWFALQP